MQYVSTRGATDALGFQDAVLTGLAPDGGLLVPARIPDMTGDLDALASLDFVGLAKRVLPAPFHRRHPRRRPRRPGR